jgi:hypothetical protein
MWQTNHVASMVSVLRGMWMGSAPQVAQGNQGRTEVWLSKRDGAVSPESLSSATVQGKLVFMVCLLSKLWRRQAHSNTQQ